MACLWRVVEDAGIDIDATVAAARDLALAATVAATDPTGTGQDPDPDSKEQ